MLQSAILYDTVGSKIGWHGPEQWSLCHDVRGSLVFHDNTALFLSSMTVTWQLKPLTLLCISISVSENILC